MINKSGCWAAENLNYQCVKAMPLNDRHLYNPHSLAKSIVLTCLL